MAVAAGRWSVVGCWSVSGDAGSFLRLEVGSRGRGDGECKICGCGGGVDVGGWQRGVGGRRVDVGDADNLVYVCVSS
jgi:hypothetical protein